jgi:hypothetical protein
MKPIEVSCKKPGKANTSKETVLQIQKLLGSIPTTYCAVKTILIPYLVKFDRGFTKKGPSQGHGTMVKKNDVLKPRSGCG